jgi:hypothetical protein
VTEIELGLLKASATTDPKCPAHRNLKSGSAKVNKMGVKSRVSKGKKGQTNEHPNFIP